MKITLVFLLIGICSIAVFTHTTPAQDNSLIVRLIYFRAHETPPRPNVDTEIEALIKQTQRFYADEMERHGFGRKTFQIETDAHGNTIVHHVVGKFVYPYYLENLFAWKKEARQQLNIPQRSITVYMIETQGAKAFPGDVAGHGSGGALGGSASIYRWHSRVIAHELGHTCGLQHDFRNDDVYIMSYTGERLSKCAAEFLDVHRAFNPSHSHLNKNTTIQMLPPRLASPPNAIRLRFKVTDRDGLHQVQLHTPEVLLGFAGGLLACKRVKGTSSTVEFLTTELTPVSRFVSVQIMDINGNLSRSRDYPIDVLSLLPPPEVVSIPDPHLAAAVRAKIGNITTHTMLYLRKLVVPGGITALTGLEHAQSLRELKISWNVHLVNVKVHWVGHAHSRRELPPSDNSISDISPLAGLTQLRHLQLEGSSISDISPLAGLTQLRHLDLSGNIISDISPLAGLTQLTDLELDGNIISDVSPLAGLTQLTDLYLGSNIISDVSPLAGLTQLRHLFLWYNIISDISPLAGLTQLRYLNLDDNSISDVSPLAGLTQLTTLDLNDNSISDVSPLVELNLTRPWGSRGLYIRGNSLNYASVHAHIPAMQANGVNVDFDNWPHTTLVKISGDTQEGEAGARLATPFVVKVMDASGTGITDMSITFCVIEGGGKLNTTTATTDANGMAQTTLTLGPKPGVNEVRVTASPNSAGCVVCQGFTYPVTFTAIATAAARPTEEVNGEAR